MEVVGTGTLQGEFRYRTEWLQRQRNLHKEREDRERRERQDRAEQDMSDLVDMAAMVVTTAEIDAFRVELDVYDTATVMALEDNRLALEAVRERLDLLLANAHVLPDGRRVFKTEDGLRVFDEHGVELALDEIDPDEIADHLTKWEEYEPVAQEAERLLDERRELLDYQDGLDQARERLDRGDINRDEFERLQDDLKITMPDAVRRHVPGMEGDQDAEFKDNAAAAPSVALDIPSDMIPDSMVSPR